MGFTSDQPPHRSAKPIPRPAPVDDPAPNAAMLKADIDTGRTGDKNEVFDPGLSVLGRQRAGHAGPGQTRARAGSPMALALGPAKNERRPQ